MIHTATTAVPGPGGTTDPAAQPGPAPAAQGDAPPDPGETTATGSDATAQAATGTAPSADLSPVADPGPLIDVGAATETLHNWATWLIGSDAADRIADDLSHSFSAVAPEVAAMRLLAALALGAAVGIERESRRKPAGLRTHILVSIAACLFILISQELANLSFGIESNMRIDPLRLIEAVTAGVAFLAAGVIFTSGGKVQNVTTGASLWLAGAIGLGCGSGQIALAAMATAIVLLVLVLLGAVESLAGTRED